MSLNKESKQELFISDYCNNASNLLAKIEGMNHAASQFEKLMHSVQLSAQKYRKMKLQLIKINNQLDCKFKWLNSQQKLNQLSFQNQIQNGERLEQQEKILEIKQGAIQIASMDWALKYLEEITIDNFQQAKSKIKQEQTNMFILEGNMNKYGEKLNIIEEKLKKSYEEARSKKRYL